MGNVSRSPIRTSQPASFPSCLFWQYFCFPQYGRNKMRRNFQCTSFFRIFGLLLSTNCSNCKAYFPFPFLPGIPLLCPPSLSQGSEGEIRWPFPSSFPPRFQKGGGGIRRPAGCYDAVVGMDVFISSKPRLVFVSPSSWITFCVRRV